MPGSKVLAEATAMLVAPEVTEPVSVVCWDRDEYLRVVIYLPIGCSGRGLGTEAFALMILLQDGQGTCSEDSY